MEFFQCGLDSICAHAMKMGDFFFPFPLSWCRSCDIVIKIEGKNINYIPITFSKRWGERKTPPTISWTYGGLGRNKGREG